MHTSRGGNSSSHRPKLRYGRACLNCRHRKIRCDGKKPSCSQCESSEIFHDCEYPGKGVTKTQVLEDQTEIAAVQRRIQELENPGQSHQSDVTTIVLSQRYSQPQESPIDSRRHVEVLPVSVSNLGFFLNVSRFTQAMNSTGTPRRPSDPRPSSSDTFVGHTPLPSPEVHVYESECLADACRTLPKLSQFGFSSYCFRVGKIVEGNDHTSAAAALVLGSGLHKFNPTSNDFVAEGERLNGMWTVFMLNNCWTDGSPSKFSLHMEESRIDAPWPLDMKEYAEIPQLPPPTTYTIQNFLGGSDYGNSLLMFEFNSFSAVLDNFIQNLSAVNYTSPSAGVFVHSLARAAVVTLHMPVALANPASESRMRVMTAVREIVHLSKTPGMTFVDALLGVVWERVCRFLMNFVLSNAAQAPPEPQDLLNTIMQAMDQMGSGCSVYCILQPINWINFNIIARSGTNYILIDMYTPLCLDGMNIIIFQRGGAHVATKKAQGSWFSLLFHTP
ncbi:hypothetical protein BDZ89DRAFT_1048483 [Hymenopellis radicata]|nr:hypothetical protein BDZ89DRAFT_1048483 [Hymenopellis radicata]